MTEFVKVTSKNEIKSGKGKVVEVNGKNIAVMNDNGEFFAMDSACAHAQGPLSEGSLENGKVTCPWHAWEFDCKTGKCAENNAEVNVYEIKIEGEDILVNPEPVRE